MAQILVIDDDLNLLQMVRLMLERVGHQVETTHKGVEGWRARRGCSLTWRSSTL